MRFSYVLLTYNRREDLLRTLGWLHARTPLSREAWETIVVDNASTDGTAEAVAEEFASVRVIRRETNEGSPARNAGIDASTAPYVVLLDDDSYPLGDTVPRALAYLDAHPNVALVGGRVVLPNGAEDAAAMPLVMPACAMCLRRSAVQRVGGFAPDFFRQAEEYDLIFRLLARGFDVKRFEDLTFRHEKTPTSRSHALIHRMDVRNNLVLIDRYFPGPMRRAYRHDWLRRYVAMARDDGHMDAVRQGIADARAARGMPRQTLRPVMLDRLFEFTAQTEAVARWSGKLWGSRVVIADFSKNLFATYQACRRAGVTVVAIADTNPAFAGMDYRGVPIEPDEVALSRAPDGIVVSTVNPARVDKRMESLAKQFDGPILRLWEPRHLDHAAAKAA